MNSEIYDLHVMLYQQHASNCTTLELIGAQQQIITRLENEIKSLCGIIMDFGSKTITRRAQQGNLLEALTLIVLQIVLIQNLCNDWC